MSHNTKITTEDIESAIKTCDNIINSDVNESEKQPFYDHRVKLLNALTDLANVQYLKLFI